MSASVPPVPFQNSITDQNGKVTMGWADWFKQVYARIGNATALSNAELQTLINNYFPVSTANIASGAVTAPKIATGAVFAAAIAGGAVGSSALAANAVTASAVASNAVAFAKLLSADWSSSIATSGYQKIGSGLYVQWGVTSSIGSGTNTVVAFPFTFPNACLQVVAGIQGNSAGVTTATGHFGTGTYTTAGFTLNNRTSAAYTFNYVAVGY